MYYISVRQAAEKWGVTMRQVQFYLRDSRVDGAIRPGHDWLIPADADKPERGQGKKQSPQQVILTSDFDEIIAEASLPLPFDTPDAILDIVKKERIRLIYVSDLSYLRGDFEQTKKCYRQTEGDDMARLRAASFAIAAAVSTGDYLFYQEVESFCLSMIKKDIGENITKAAELCLATAYVSAFAPSMVPDWLKNGDFTTLSSLQLKLDAIFKRAKYFQALKQYESMLAMAQTTFGLTGTVHGISVSDIYLRLACAIACCGLNRTDEARRYLTGALNTYLPHGFITPFAESAQAFNGLLEQILERDFPSYYETVTRQWIQTVPNWIRFHNRFTKDNITSMLSLRDYQLASLVARRVPYKEIARQFNISVGRLSNIMSEIYAELYVSNRDELARFIL